MSDKLKKLADTVIGDGTDELIDFKMFVRNANGLDSDTVAEETTNAIISYNMGITSASKTSPEAVESKSYKTLAKALGIF